MGFPNYSTGVLIMDELERLKSFAGAYCIAIFELFDELEILEHLSPIRYAWQTGRELSALTAEKE